MKFILGVMGMFRTYFSITLFINFFLLWVCSLSFAADVDLYFWQFSIDEELAKPIVEAFEIAHPHIKLHMQQLSWDFGHDKIVTSLIAGNPPDVLEIGSTWTPKFAEGGALYDLTSEIKPIQNQYLMWEPVTFKEKIYGMPWLVGTRFLFYNQDLFQRAGLDPKMPPRTWSELLEAARKIRTLSKDIYGYGIAVAEDYAPWHTFIPYLWNGGGEILSKDFKKSLFHSKASIETFQFYKSLKPYALLNRQEQIDQLFAAGKIGIILSGAWNFKSITRTNSELNYGVGLVPTPTLGKIPTSFGGGEMLAIIQKTKHPKEALLLLNYLTSRKVELLIAKKQQNILPSFKAALQDPFFQKDPKMKGFSDQMLSAKSPPSYPEWLQIERTLSSTIDEVMLQDKPIENAVAAASLKINKLLSKTMTHANISDKQLTMWILFIFIVLFILFLAFFFRKEAMGNFSTWIFLSPWLLLFFIFGLYPLIYSLVISFSDYQVLSSRFSFSGIENYLASLKDPEFLKATAHTLFFSVGTIPFTVMFSLLLAVLIHEGVPWKSLFEAGFFLPVVTSIIVIATLFTYFYSEGGFLNYILEFLGLPRPTPAWLINKNWALLSIMIMAIWSSVGYYVILFLAGLSSIPISLYEASRIDGANSIQQFLKITLPQLKPIILFIVVLNTINSLQVFPEIFTMTKGGPSRSTTTVVYYLYEKGFSEFQMGQASAIAYLLCLMIFIFTYAQMKTLKERA